MGFVGFLDAPIERKLHSEFGVMSALGSLKYSDTCSIHPITASSFSFSRKSRSSYPYMLSKPVFGPRLDCNLRVSWQLSHRSQPSIGLHPARSCPSAGPRLFSQRPLFSRLRPFLARR